MPKKRKYISGTNKIAEAAKNGASKQEIRGMVAAHNASLRGTKNQGKNKIDVRTMWSYMPKPKNTESKPPKAKETITLPTRIDADGNPSGSTIEVERQPYHSTEALYKNYAQVTDKKLLRDETYSDYAAEIRGEAPADDLLKPGPPKRAVFKMKRWSGYQNKK
jgi:hypothetical protein